MTQVAFLGTSLSDVISRGSNRVINVINSKKLSQLFIFTGTIFFGVKKQQNLSNENTA